MKKYLATAALIVGFSVPAFAVNHVRQLDEGLFGHDHQTHRLTIKNDGRIQITGRPTRL